MARTGVFLVNLGTPTAPTTRAVRRYLREFLSDPRVFDMPWLSCQLLLHCCILPFRPRRSAAAYRAIWLQEGSPLLVHGRALQRGLAELLGSEIQVELAMRYQVPTIREALRRFYDAAVDRIVLFPLFPHHAASSWGTAIEKVFTEACRTWDVPAIQVIPPYYDHPHFIEALATVARPVLHDLQPDHVLMTFHGLPERHVRKSDATGGQRCLQAGCCERIVAANRHCYRAQCFATARLLAAALGLDAQQYQVAFQSRLGRDPWIQPFTDVIVPDLARQGCRRLAVISPSFTADCLETLEEIGIRARDEFRAAGGDELRLVPSLNAHPAWVSAVQRIIREQIVLQT